MERWGAAKGDEETGCWIGMRWDTLARESANMEATDREPEGRDEGLSNHRTGGQGGGRAVAAYREQLWCRDVRGLCWFLACLGYSKTAICISCFVHMERGLFTTIDEWTVSVHAWSGLFVFPI